MVLLKNNETFKHKHPSILVFKEKPMKDCFSDIESFLKNIFQTLQLKV